MSEEHARPTRLTDLEMRVLRALRLRHQQRWPNKRVDDDYLQDLSQVAVDALTTGSASGRRLEMKESRRYPDPGSAPERIRTLARWIEASYHTMPNGWVSADEMKEHPHE